MRALVIGAIAPEGVAHPRARGIEIDEESDTPANGELRGRLGEDADAGPHRGVVEVMEEVEKAVEADFARIVRLGP